MPQVSVRIGLGHDTHRLMPGKPLVLGGMRIEHDSGLVGHSDADIVLHALTDALLGAAGLGDIGDHFPDTDPANAGKDSGLFALEAKRMVGAMGYRIVNIDVIIHAQKPRLASHKKAIAESMAHLLQVEPGQVNVKAKTGENVGPVGRQEAMECHAIVLLEKRESGEGS